MKAFISTILLLFSVILSAQIINEIDTESFLTNGRSRISIDTAFLNSNSRVEIDSVRQKKINKAWCKISLFEIGYGGSSMQLDSINTKILYNGYFKTSVGSFEMGFHSLNGLGFGTKIVEVFNIQNKIGINSYVPFYTYYPIYISKNTKLGKEGEFEKIPSMINVYAGGSLWCKTSGSGFFSKDTAMTDKYLHIGINYMFFNYSFDTGVFGNGNFSLDGGMIFCESKDANFKNIFHVGFIWAFGGWVIKPLYE